MKLVRYGATGREKPGLVDQDGRLRSLAAVVPDIGGAQLSPAALRKLQRLKPDRLPLVRGKPRLGPPVSGIAKLIGIQVHIEPHGMNALGLNLDDLIALQWKSVISWLTLQKLVLSAVFVAGGYWFYSRRELT